MEHDYTELTPQEIREDQADDELNAIWTEQTVISTHPDLPEFHNMRQVLHFIDKVTRPAQPETNENYRRDMIAAGRGHLLP